jgi:RNA polymerase sigma-70 factor (ECF subfamily)
VSKEATSQAAITEARFCQTHWTLVLSARTPDARQALEELCRIYWPPLYAFLRRSGCSKEDSEDLVQGFFAHLLQNERLNRVDPAKGKFRSFLLVGLKHHLRDQWDKQRSQRRGNGEKPIPLPEDTSALPPDGAEDPSEVYDRQWALALISEVLRRLREKCTADGKQRLMDALQPYLTGDAERGDYSGTAPALQMSEGAVRIAVHRLRNEYQALLREEVGRTVGCAGEIDDEIKHLIRALRPPQG